jgi:hypothetical protein
VSASAFLDAGRVGGDATMVMYAIEGCGRGGYRFGWRWTIALTARWCVGERLAS